MATAQLIEARSGELGTGTAMVAHGAADTETQLSTDNASIVTDGSAKSKIGRRSAEHIFHVDGRTSKNIGFYMDERTMIAAGSASLIWISN